MLRLLLDEHISPTIAKRLVARIPKINITAIADWHGGIYLSLSDEEILLAARSEQLSLVTYDLRTIAPILKSWGEQGKSHGGVIFIDNQTVMSNDFGGLVLALEMLWNIESRSVWTNRVMYLTRQRPQITVPS